MLWSDSTAWRCMHASTVPARAGELFVRTLVQRSAQRLAADVAPSAARARRAARNGLATDGSPGQTHTLGRVSGQVAHPGGYGQAGLSMNGAAGLLRNGYEPAAGNGQVGGSAGFGVPGFANGYTSSGNGYASLMGNGRTGQGESMRPGTGPVRSPELGYAPPPGSDGLAPEPVSTALLAQPRAPPLVDSMKKDQREARSPVGRL